MEDRLNLGREVRELKLGTTFTNPGAGTSFHTLKCKEDDFKPASVDPTKMAILNVGSNNQVTVTVPHLDGSGIPKTVFKGNQKNYTKECVLIVDKNTGQVTLERLHHNIQVKKTRSESTNKNVPPVVPKIVTENLTQRTSSKTKVSTGVRKNAITGFVPKNSPHQGSPSYQHHKSPQSAPAWNANNGQSTLPSIPIIGLDDDLVPPAMNPAPSASQSSSMGASMPIVAIEPTPDFPPATSSAVAQSQATGSGNSVAEPDILSSSDSSSDSESSGSDSDSDSTQSSPDRGNSPVNHLENGVLPTHLISLSRDLCLSESNSDSDDD